MRKLALGIAFFPCLFLTACGASVKTDTTLIYTMDTVVSLAMYNVEDSSVHFEKIKEIYKEVALVSDDYKSGGDTVSVYDLNQNREALVSNTLLDILEESLEVYRDTKGYFNPFIGKLSHKWKEKISKENVLSDEEIDAELQVISNTSLKIEGNKVTIVGDGNIDLGGIAKGYATKMAKEYLEEMGVSSYYIDAGNSSIVLGNKNGGNITVGLSKPYDYNGYVGILKEKNLSISCSSPQNQYIRLEDKIYHHLINPFTGYPSLGVDSVFILNQDPMLGDAYSTAVFNMSYEDAVAFSLEKNISIIIYKDDSVIYKSEGVTLYE